MANATLELYIDKTKDFTYPPRLTFDNAERGKTIDVKVFGEDEQPYDFTGKTIKFVETSQPYGDNTVIDDQADHFTDQAPKEGKFTYTMPEQAFYADGNARFEFWQDDTKIDTTCPIQIVLTTVGPDITNTDYITTFENLENKFKSQISSASDLVTQTQASVTDLTNYVNTLKQEVENLQTELSAAQATIKTLQSK